MTTVVQFCEHNGEIGEEKNNLLIQVPISSTQLGFITLTRNWNANKHQKIPK